MKLCQTPQAGNGEKCHDCGYQTIESDPIGEGLANNSYGCANRDPADCKQDTPATEFFDSVRSGKAFGMEGE